MEMIGHPAEDWPQRRLFGLLRDHPEAYSASLEAHFLRHLEPFAVGGRNQSSRSSATGEETV